MDRRILPVAALGCVLTATFLGLQGCASGTDALGRTVVGIPIGIDPNTEGAGIKAAGGLIGGIFGGPAGAAVGSAIAGTVVTALGTWGGLQARARRKAETTSAELTGAERGWNEREQASTIQLPLGTPLPGAAPGPVPGNPA